MKKIPLEMKLNEIKLKVLWTDPKIRIENSVQISLSLDLFEYKSFKQVLYLVREKMVKNQFELIRFIPLVGLDDWIEKD